MRRKTRNVPNAKSRAALYACAALAILFYALPKLPKLEHGLPGSFAVVWLLFAGLALTANLYFLVGADKERSKMLEARETSPQLPAKPRAVAKERQFLA